MTFILTGDFGTVDDDDDENGYHTIPNVLVSSQLGDPSGSDLTILRRVTTHTTEASPVVSPPLSLFVVSSSASVVAECLIEAL